MAVIENRFVCDLAKPVQAQALKGNVFSLDNLGSRISVLIYENGQPATISGSVTANCILPDGSTVNVNGDLTSEGDGSKAYVDVPQSCLLIPGILKIAIKCTSSSVITTLAAIVANVYMTKTDNVITPSQQIIADWNAEISASLANQDTKINNLKSALAYDHDSVEAITGVVYGEWVSGYYKTPDIGSSVSLTSSTNWVTSLMEVTPGETVTFYAYGGTSNSRQRVFIDEDWKAVGTRSGANVTTKQTVTVPTGAKYLAVNNQIVNRSSGFYVYKNPSISEQMTDIDNQFDAVQDEFANVKNGIASITGNTICDFVLGRWYNTSDTIDVTTPEYENTAACVAIPCQEGDVFTLTGQGFTSSHTLYAFIDSNGIKLRYSSSRTNVNKENITAPENAVYLVVNVAVAYPYELYKGRLISQLVRSDVPTIEDVKSFEDENGVLTAGEYVLVSRKSENNIRSILVCVQAMYYSGETENIPTIRFDCYSLGGSRIFYSHKYQFASDKEYKKQEWRIPNCFEVGRIQIVITVPEGTTLDIKYFNCSYETAVRYGTGNVIFHAHRGFDKLLPPGAYNAYVAAADLGFQSCIEIPKFTSDGVAVCFHNDGGSSSPLSSVFTMPDGSAVEDLTTNSKISDFTYAELMQWSIGYSKNAVFADAKISTMDDFLRICAETGMRPIFSIHPNPTVEQWVQLKALLDKYKLTKWLSVKSGDTAVWKKAIDTFGDGNIFSIINIVGTSSTYDILTKIANGRVSSGAATTRIDVEFFDEGLKSATYGEAQHEMLEDAIEAGYVASVVLDNATKGEEIKGYMNLGVTEFTNCRHASIGLNW